MEIFSSRHRAAACAALRGLGFAPGAAAEVCGGRRAVPPGGWDTSNVAVGRTPEFSEDIWTG